jgi:transposase
MPSNNSKYTQEMRDQTVKYILEKGISATQMAEETGIDKNTVCSWVRAYNRRNNLPSYAEAKGLKRSEPKTNSELGYRVKELEREVKKKEKELLDEKEKVEILKKSLHIFMRPPE